tara:strand:- start:5262 stop:5489 length:228 start_codon:yes stop_codon:yes gene_type:complete
MLKLKVMGHMKFISQMVEDGSFDRDFMPAYKDAVIQNKPSFEVWGTKYSRGYARSIVRFIMGCIDDIETLKTLEK